MGNIFNSKKLNQQGSITLMFVIVFIFFLVIGVIAVDVGMAVVEKAKITTAADAAAIAGAYRFETANDDLTQGDIELNVKKEAERFFYKNFGVEIDELTNEEKEKLEEQFEIVVDVSYEDKTVTVRSVRTINNFFARLFEIPNIDVHGQSFAQAALEPVSAYGNVIPFGVSYELLVNEGIIDSSTGDINFDVFDNLEGDGTDKWEIGPGNWGILDPKDLTGQTWEEAFEDGMMINIDNEVDLEIDSQPGVAGVNYMKDSENNMLNIELVAPIVDFGDNQGRIRNAPIKGFLAIVITDINGDGENAVISIKFKEHIATGDFQTSQDAPDTGLSGVVLKR